MFAALANDSVVTSTLGQMVAPWVLLAAIVGSRARRGPATAAVAGAIALPVASTTYYAVGLISGDPLSARLWLLWSAVGVVVGPVAAATGWYARFGSGGLRLTAIASLAAVCIAESVVLWGHIDHLDAHLTYVVVGIVGLAIPAVALRDEDLRAVLKATMLAGALAMPLAVAFEIAFSRLGVV